MSHGLPRLSGGIAARERAAWEAPCRIHANRGDRTRTTAAVIESLSGPVDDLEELVRQTLADVGP